MTNKVEAKEAPPEKKLECKRCGQCCSKIILPVSPLRLKRLYLIWRGWHDNARCGRKSTKKHRTALDVWLLYPMLIFIREAPELIKHKQAGDFQSEIKYMYRCKHLSMDNEIATCTIHNIKPWLCSSYGKIPASASKFGKNSYYPNCIWLK